PVIASDKVGAARDLVAPVAPDFVYPCGDVDALARILRGALSDRSRLTSLAAAAKLRIGTWSPRENIAGMIEAIRVAVSPVGRGSIGVPTANPAAAPPAKSPKLSE